MTHEPSPGTETSTETASRLRRAARAVRLTLRTLQVRLRFILILGAVFVVAGQWDTIRNYWDRMTSEITGGRAARQPVSQDTEFFCPMDPGVVSAMPGKCDICNMALVRRKIGDMAPLPSGVLARMQLTPYRVQLAGIQTAPVEYRATEHEITLTGIVRDDGLVQCPVSEHDRFFLVAGQAVNVRLDDGARRPGAKGKVSALDVDPGDSRVRALIRLDEVGGVLPRGTRVFATARRPVAELAPFQSQPANPPPLIKGDLLAVYVCPQHPEVLATDRGRCPVDRNNRLQRQGLLANQRVGWWCPMHPKVTADHPETECQACGGMKLVPRVITYRPGGQVLTVPESAVVDTGTRTVAFVERMPGVFDSVEIAVGPRCGDAYPVASGLDPGQRVAISGAFLLDAETRLNPSLAATYFGAARTARSEPTRSAVGTRVAAEPGVCPVTGKPLGSMGPPVSVTINGRTVQLCCKGCEEPLRASPDTYLSQPKAR